MANDRDCENCKHYKEVLCKGGIFYHSCESWDCEFEPKEDEPFEHCEDCISRQAVLDSIHANCVYENEYNLTAKHIEDAVKQLPPVNPQIICPIHGVYCEDCSAYEKKPNINEVLDKIRAEIMDCLKALDEIEKSGLNIYLPNEISGRRLTYQQCLEFIDKYKAEGSGKC